MTQTPLFFDLDGTLTDPQQGITGCIRFAMQQLQIAAPAQEQLTWCIGPPLHESFVELVGEAKAGAAAGTELFVTGANTALDAIAQPKKAKRKV